MRALLFFIIFSNFLFGFGNCGELPADQQEEQTLITTLLKNYTKNIRPASQVSVDITASLKQILSIDEKQQIMTSSLFIVQKWIDQRLSWTPNSSNNSIQVVMLPTKSLWIPDTMIMNSADSSGYLSVSDFSLASVSDTGLVYLILPILNIKTRCNLVVQNFPFDKQICTINLTSWGQGANRIQYTESAPDLFDMSDYDVNPLWDLFDTDILITRSQDRVPFEETYNTIISIQLSLRRKPLYFIMNGIFACLILNCITLLSFALPFILQISLCMTCFLTYSVYSLNFSNLFPQQSQYLMMITLFFLLSIVWTFISMVWFILYIYFTTAATMPHVLYVLCEKLQKLFNASSSKRTHPNKTTENKNDKPDMRVIDNSTKSHDTISTTILKQRININNENTQDPEFEDTHSVQNNTIDSATRRRTILVSALDTDKESKEKCTFCDRCKSCQADFQADKAKTKTKKDIENKCNILNYLAFACVLLFMLVSNLAVWLSISR